MIGCLRSVVALSGSSEVAQVLCLAELAEQQLVRNPGPAFAPFLD